MSGAGREWAAAVLARVRGLDVETLEVWIAQDWVRPRRQGGSPVFEEIDVARLRLILELRDEMAVGEPAIPVVLSLLDQLHATRGQLQQVINTLQGAGPDERARDVVLRLLR
jgi:chaperone modulatory protein CbpM